jgi:hypothetical protein
VVALVLDVPLDDELVDADGRDEVAAVPEGALRELLGLLLEPAGTLALDHRHGVGDGVLRGYRDEQADMFVPDAPGVDGDALPLADQLDDSLELEFNMLVFQHLAAVFGSPDEAVLADVGTVAQLINPSVGQVKNTSFLGVFLF